MKTLVDLFNTFAALGDKTVFVNRTGVRRLVVSYREFHALAMKMANLLAQNGVEHGDRVLIWGPNSSWWAVAYLGIIIRGAIAVPVDFMSDLARAESICNLTKAKVVLQSRFKPERVTAGTLMLLEDLQYLLEDIGPIGDLASPAAEDTAQLIYTSAARVSGLSASVLSLSPLYARSVITGCLANRTCNTGTDPREIRVNCLNATRYIS
jgi:long-chain acyl-CoA synthetase